MSDADVPVALPGDRFDVRGPAGRVNVYVAGEGRPLLLIHSINAAASAAEVKPLYKHYARSRRVFAIDLPGFGLSEHGDRVYSPRLMTDALHAVVEEIRGQSLDVPVDALALSLSCEFLVRAAVERPEAFRSLALVSPTGFRGSQSFRQPPGTCRGSEKVHAFLRRWNLGSVMYRALTKPGVIRYFLRRTWGSKQIDDELWQYDIRVARVPGAEYAPLYFLSGLLFSADIHTLYESLEQPVWMSHGVRGDFTDYRQEHLVSGRLNWRFTVYPTGAFPHFEAGERFCADYDALLAPAATG